MNLFEKLYCCFNLDRKRVVISFMWVTLPFLGGFVNCAETAESGTARKIMERVDAQQRTISDSMYSKSQLSTCNFGKSKKKIKCVTAPRVKVMESVSFQYGERKRDSKSISIIGSPPSERGIAMLTYRTDKQGLDIESWLYLSSIGKVKRVAGGNDEQQEPTAFFGSEFTSEDLENGKTDKYDYSILQEGDYGGNNVWVIQRTPKPERLKFTSYSKSISWVDKQRNTILQVQTYDKSGSLYKRFRVDVDPEFLSQRSLVDLAYRNRVLEEMRD